ncbi:MAG: alpha-galactosidase [Chitinophagaceae bacterium]|nr:alpha-galactosidase [Chitinophagaceae bacterium]
MNRLILFLGMVGFSGTVNAQSLRVDRLPLYNKAEFHRDADWLIDDHGFKAAVYKTPEGYLALSNGLVTRTFTLAPNGATIALDNLITNESLVRAVSPEATLWINGREIKVGGLTGQPIGNYLLPEWIPEMKADPSSLHLVSYAVSPVKARMEWNRRTAWSPQHLPWPPKGLELVFTYKAGKTMIENLRTGIQENEREGELAKESAAEETDFLEGLVVQVHYEIYDGLPLLSKWVRVENNGSREIIVNNIRSEQLAVTEAESAVEHKQRWQLPPIFVESDFAFGSGTTNAAENACVEWQTDSTYTTQVNYTLQTPTRLVCMPKTGMGQELAPGASFESMRLWELLYDSYDRERRGLSERKLYRTIAPWVTENPIIMHVSSAADAAVKKAIDQCAEVGFEMVIMTFGSGFNIEDTSSQNLQRMKALKEYGKSKGVAIGGYSLLASRSIDAQNDVVMPDGMQPAFGHSPCLLSNWGEEYFNKLYHFYSVTGQDLLEHDGSYPGDVCASTAHPGHRGLEDSRWKQFREIQAFYRWCRSKGVYLNVPDWYFLNGSSKTAMGYRETNWSLPRALQEIIERQNIYDGTWEKTPSMGWMFVPLVQYHGGGAAATIEPLKEHLPHYGQRLANLFGAGVQACYRGPQLYDAPETRNLVKKWVSFYKKHREALDADIIHLRRPDGRDYDAILHVNPQGKEKGLLMVYNPLNEPVTREIEVDLYYTGLKDQAWVTENDGVAGKRTLQDSKMKLQVIIPAKSQKWFVFTGLSN